MSSNKNSANLSSNKHWPSLFRAKHATPHHSTSSATSSRLPFTEGKSSEERNPEPKPRWNPKPEQIRILEGIFNSGTVNPPREEIRRIRAQLQEYGQVGDANVFYWFQNRKSRSKQKLNRTSKTITNANADQKSSSSSSSADCGSQPHPKTTLAQHVIQSPPTPTPTPTTQYLHPFIVEGSSSSPPSSAVASQHQLLPLTPYNSLHSNPFSSSATSGLVLNPDTEFQASANLMSTVTVFVNGMQIELPAGPINVWTLFGDRAVLVHSSGHPVPLNESGISITGLQHGDSYYLLEASM